MRRSWMLPRVNPQVSFTDEATSLKGLQVVDDGFLFEACRLLDNTTEPSHRNPRVILNQLYDPLQSLTTHLRHVDQLVSCRCPLYPLTLSLCTLHVLTTPPPNSKKNSHRASLPQNVHTGLDGFPSGTCFSTHSSMMMLSSFPIRSPCSAQYLAKATYVASFKIRL